jgi:hypothetical protein
MNTTVSKAIDTRHHINVRIWFVKLTTKHVDDALSSLVPTVECGAGTLGQNERWEQFRGEERRGGLSNVIAALESLSSVEIPIQLVSLSSILTEDGPLGPKDD